jgi:hypothetical protein
MFKKEANTSSEEANPELSSLGTKSKSDENSFSSDSLHMRVSDNILGGTGDNLLTTD